MKNYAFKKAKTFIENHRETISEVSLGMNEDWFWTAETIFQDNAFAVDLDDPELKIGGINGSSWATPTMEVTYFDGDSEKIEVSEGEFDLPVADRLEKEFMVKGGLGVLSAPAQEDRGDVDRVI